MRNQNFDNTNNIYNFIKSFIGENGYSPSIREIMNGVGLNSTSVVWSHLTKLREEGKITYKEKCPRTIVVI